MDHFIDEENVQDNDDPQSFDNVFSPKSKGLSQMDEEVLQDPAKQHSQESVQNKDKLVLKYDHFTLNFYCNIICIKIVL